MDSKRLVWNPALGIGFYPVHINGQYDQAYWDKYVTYSKTPLGAALNQARLDLARRFCPTEQVVDLGIGCGHFVEARGENTFGYDVNEAGIRWLLDRKRWWDPWSKDPENLTCWDSLEHLARPAELVSRIKRRLLVSLPIFRDEAHVLSSKHFRPDEHYWYWTRDGFVRWMGVLGFKLQLENTMETDLGREDIGTFVFSREGA